MPCEFGWFAGLGIDQKPFLDLQQVRGSVQADPMTRAAKGFSDQPRNRTFSFGSGNMDYRSGKMWVSKLLEEKLHSSKAIGRLIVGAIDSLFVVNPFVEESDGVDVI